MERTIPKVVEGKVGKKYFYIAPETVTVMCFFRFDLI